MQRLFRRFVLTASACVLAGTLPSTALAQRGHPPAHAPARHPGVHPGHVVFVGGYFYDPFFGPYPWWGPALYPYPYYPAFESRAVLRVLATPTTAGVYVDGFYAGIVDDFNGFFEGLPLTPGGHEVVLYLPGYQTSHQRLYMAPGTTFKLRATLTPLRPGEGSEPPVLAPALPSPPTGTYMPPHTAPTTMPPQRSAEELAATFGTLDLEVQPGEAAVRIDGEPWVTSDHGRFVVRLRVGTHRLDVSSSGYRSYETDIVVPDGEAIQIKVTLTRGITR